MSVDSGLLAQGDGESSANASDGSDGVWHESLSVQVSVQHSDNVLKVCCVLYVQALALNETCLPCSSTLNRFYKNRIKRMNADKQKQATLDCIDDLV